MPVFGLYSHIRANRWRSGLLIVGLFLLVFAVAYAIALVIAAGAELEDAPFEAIAWAAFDSLLFVAPGLVVGTATWVALSLVINARVVDAVTGAREIAREDDPRLFRMLENLCISRGMPTPRLKIVDSEALNAFASGITQKQYAVTLTSGLVAALDDAEIEAVMAHELTHIRNEDVRLMMIAVVVVGVISFVGEIVFRSLRFGAIRGASRGMGGGLGGARVGGRGGGGRGGGGAAVIAILVAIAIVLVAWALSIGIKLALSRSREYLADAGAVELTKNPDAMISALLKIRGRADIERAPATVMEMCVENPRVGFTALLSTHPTIESRVEALVRNAGGRMPPPEALAPQPPPAEPGGEPAPDSAPEGDAPPRGPWG